MIRHCERIDEIWSSRGRPTHVDSCRFSCLNLSYLFRQNTGIAYLHIVMTSSVVVRRSFVRPSQSERLKYLKNGFTTIFYTDIRNDLLYNYTGYDVTSYFGSEVTGKKLSKMSPPTALGRISRERFKRGSRTFTALSGPNNPINLPNIKQLVAFSRRQNENEYCIEVRKTGPAGNKLRNSATVYPGITKFPRTFILTYSPILQPHRIWRHELHMPFVVFLIRIHNFTTRWENPIINIVNSVQIQLTASGDHR